jgi:microsomal dipeptidase-like Zn-dependent dipeptidase/gamma-glutamyl-gamma-aminobutyrate hydrolase PuuD
MNDFDLKSHLSSIHKTFPAAPYRPVIGITANFTNGDATLRDRYYQQVVAAGGTPVIIPPVSDTQVLVNTLDTLDGLLLSGGADYNPLWAGEEPSPLLHGINATRDLPELLITQLAYNRQIPILGICRGIQTLAMALGGKVAQDISLSPNPAGKGGSVRHSQDADRTEPTHTVTVEKDSTLYNIYSNAANTPSLSEGAGGKLFVNSFHHQAVSDPGKRFRATAFAADGVIETIESTEHKPIMGVQWHPEWMESGLPLFQWLVEQASNFHVAKQLHRRILTLDTHCDTPMFFAQGIHFDQRDPRILVDLHKMTEGRQDAVTMVAYLPQPKIGETFSSKVVVNEHFNGDGDASPSTFHLTPSTYADLIFDKIEDIVRKNSRYISIARTPSDLYQDKRKGRKSIMLGIENGLALNHDLQNVKHFAQRGVVYITLCHNGDNDICDSARGCNTHNGVSSFGERVIEQMNLNGIMVDLSHAGEKSFYDALEISATPIVCSHSNCRALCDHPRNLTDEQMRALARRGGVMHITLYPGFLVKNPSAPVTILDAMRHLEHAINVMGIDHVGLGTDFDGDGGIIGLADSSEMINFTLELLRRKYNERDIEKIWGGNWLRVMSQVQKFPQK